MKEFFDRHNAALDVGDIRRLLKVLADDLGSVLKEFELIVRLFDDPQSLEELEPNLKQAVARNQVLSEPETGRLHLPILWRGKPLALVTATPPPNGSLSEDSVALLPPLIRISLEKLLLYKINITDPETGLYNNYYFRSFLSRRLEPVGRQPGSSGRLKPLTLDDKGTQSDLSILLAEVRDYDRVASEHGRLEAVRILKNLAFRLRRGVGSPGCLARLGPGRLGLALPQIGLEQIQELARKTLENTPEADPPLPSFRLSVGLASFPHDQADVLGQPEISEAEDFDPAGLLLSRAELALHQSLNDKDKNILSFQDVLDHGGRVVQSLPYNRVVVNLGRIAGARAGQVFVLQESSARDEVNYKGEVVLFDVRDDFSLGELINLRSSLTRAEPGDALILSRMSLEDPAEERAGGRGLDPLLGAPDHQGFLGILSKKIVDRDRFTIILIRVDGYDAYRTTMGHLESDKQFKALFDLIDERKPSGSVLGRFSTESLVLFCPDQSGPEMLALAQEWRDLAAGRLRRTASFGLADYPCGPFDRQDILGNAQKAVEHASFLGHSSAALFDSVSLNISGDKKFESGDWEGAVEDYQKALEINPEDLNVLNSLGVCYGYKNKSDLALQTFDQVLGRDPDNLMAHYNKGFALAMLNRTREALECFRRAAALEPDNFDVLFQAGKTALDLELIEEALGSFEQAAGLPDRRTIVFRYLGQTLLKAGRTDDAVEAFKAAARHDPEDAASLSQLGVLYLEKGADLDVALSLIRQAADLDPTNQLFRQRLARALAAYGDLKAAEKEYLAVLELGARSREVYYELGLAVRRLGRDEEARRWFRESLKQDPEFKPAAEALESRPD